MHVADDETRRPDPLTAIASGAEALARGADLDQALEALRSEEHTSELQSLRHLVCRLLLEKKKHSQLKCSNIRIISISNIHSILLSTCILYPFYLHTTLAVVTLKY